MPCVAISRSSLEPTYEGLKQICVHALCSARSGSSLEPTYEGLKPDQRVQV